MRCENCGNRSFLVTHYSDTDVWYDENDILIKFIKRPIEFEIVCKKCDSFLRTDNLIYENKKIKIRREVKNEKE